MLKEAEPIFTDIVGAVGCIVLNRPDQYNSLSTDAFARIETAIADMEAGGTVRAILIRAEGKHFCTGADINEVADAVAAGPAAIDTYLRAGQSALARLEESSLPIVATVQGLCLAGGLELILACDVVLAGASARFGDQHVNFGFLAAWGGSHRLVKTVGLRRATDLMFTGHAINANEAMSFGLITKIIPDEQLAEASLAYCAQIAQRSRSGIKAMKHLGRNALESTLADALVLERKTASTQLQSLDGTEGFAAFREKRKPFFT